MRTVSRLILSLVAMGTLVLAVYWSVGVGASTAPFSVPTPAATALPAATASQATVVSAISADGSGAKASATAGSSAAGSVPAPTRLTLDDTAVRGDINPQVASVVEAVRSGNHPERLSVFIAPGAFDAAAFAANPQAYLDVVEPGRVWITADPGLTVTPLITEQTDQILIPLLGSTPLRVRGVPLAPVSFTILDGGVFPNHLSTITVRADGEGVASTVYTATPGTADDVQILVGSPLASGTLTMVVHVLIPDQTQETAAIVVPSAVAP